MKPQRLVSHSNEENNRGLIEIAREPLISLFYLDPRRRVNPCVSSISLETLGGMFKPIKWYFEH